MATTWIVAADSSRARVLQVADREGRLLEVHDLVNPQARLHDRDLQTDAEPRFNGHGGVGKPGTAPTGGPASDRETQGAVMLVAPPKFPRRAASRARQGGREAGGRGASKDISGFSAREIERYLEKPSR
jgi:hypothetical protein